MLFEMICEEYDVFPGLVADDLHESGVEVKTEKQLRKWLEENY
jgi:hypothetical protein